MAQEADLQYWDDTLRHEVRSLRLLLRSADGLVGRDVASALERAEDKLRAARGTERGYKTEHRLVADPVRRRAHREKLSKLSGELASCANDLAALREGTERGELFAGAAAVASSQGGNDEVSGEEAGDLMLNEMNGIQDKTKGTLQNIKNMVKASQEVGKATNDELARQGEQIGAINDAAMRMEDDLNKSDKLIKAFGRRMATDRFIQCFACVNVLLLVGVVLYAVLRNGKNEAEGGTGTVGDGRRFLRGLLPSNDVW